MLSKAKETAEVVTGTVANATATVVEKAIGVVEQYDEGAVERPKQFGGIEGEKQAKSNEESKEESKEQKKEESKAEGEGSQSKGVALDESLRRLKMVSGDLLDLWLYEGSKGIKFLQESKAYKMTDPYINYMD